MAELRDAHGSRKLGVRVLAEISQVLAGLGFGHVPIGLPSHQHELVRLYKRGTPVGQLIDSVLTPSEQNDKALVEWVGTTGPDYTAIIQSIRDLVACVPKPDNPAAQTGSSV